MAWRKKRSGPSQTNEEYWKEFADELTKDIENGTAPWQKGWKPGKSFMPENMVTGKAYQGGNALYLMVKAHKKGYADNRWATYKQVKEAGGQVLAGEKATRISFYKPLKKEEDSRTARNETGREGAEQERERYVLKRYAVFNLEQTEGLKQLERTPAIPEWKAIANVEEALKRGAERRHVNGDRAHYNMPKDQITLPEQAQFDNARAYYLTALHEAGHSTGHPSRMDRESLQTGIKGGFGSEPYAREELRAEISSMMSGDKLGIGHEPQHGAAYVKGWVSVLKDDPMEIQRAAAEAARISDHLCKGLERERASTDKDPEKEKDGKAEAPDKIPEQGPGQGWTPLHEAAETQSPERIRELVAGGQDPNAQNEHGETPLHRATIQNPDLKTQVALIEAGANVNAQDKEGATPLHRAVEQTSSGSARILLERGADPNIQDNEGRTPLHRAYAAGRQDTVDRLIEHGADLKVRDTAGLVPTQHDRIGSDMEKNPSVTREIDTLVDGRARLHDAAATQSKHQIREAVAQGADVNVRNVNGETPLHRAVIRNPDMDVHRELTTAGADVNARDNTGATPLHRAVQVNSFEATKALLERGADPNVQDNEGRAPLHYAYADERQDQVNRLLEHGANLEVRDKRGLVPIQHASPGVESDGHTIKTIEDPNRQDDYGQTPLHRAAAAVNSRNVDRLVRMGADPNVGDDTGKTPLHHAAEAVNGEVAVKRLLNAGANPHIATKLESVTPLHLAAASDSPQSVDALVKAGADPNVVDKHGQTPLHVAGQNCAADIETRLIQAGANANIRDDQGKTPLDKAEHTRQRSDPSKTNDEAVRILRTAAMPERQLSKSR